MELGLGRWQESSEPMRFEANQLVTHGVILGMTGSGKTGLAMGLLEELVLAGTPLLLIDPKGDLANLALLYPEASPEQLEPWVDAQEAQRQSLSPRQLAQNWAEQIQKGRLQWGLGPSRVRELAERMELRIFTPGSRSGRSVNLLSGFQVPEPDVLEDPEARSEQLSETIQSLLALVGLQVDPLRSPESLVLSQILDQAWQNGQSLSLEDLILRLADPPFKKVGVFPLETFYPAQQRLDLAMKLNALMVSPAFAPWCEGQPLDLAALHKPSENGKTPVSLFYLAHLGDAERMFFVSTLLQRLKTWSRRLPGSGSLRSLLYFDEVAGYLPPHPHNPPSKSPLLTLLKQSRAVGVGVVLATQNPVDLDYKGLSNMGTWWIGRMQTSQDRERVMDGLTLAVAGMDRNWLQQEFEQLKSRVFLVKSPDLERPGRFETRFAMALLRGPVTRAELPRLQANPQANSPLPETSGPSLEPAVSVETLLSQPPRPKGDFAQAFLDPEVVFSAQLEGCFEAYACPRRSDGKMVWQPALWGELALRFDEGKGGFLLDEVHHYLWFPMADHLPSQWTRLSLEPQHLLAQPPGSSLFENLPSSFDEAHELKAAQVAMVEDIFRRVTSSQWVHPGLKLYGAGGESEGEFRLRVERAVQERIDRRLAQLQQKADREIATLQNRLARHESRLNTLQNESQRRQSETLWTAGAAMLGFFTGKKSNLKTTLTSYHRTSSARDRAQQVSSELDEIQRKMQEVQDRLLEEISSIEVEEKKAFEAVEARPVRLGRNDIRQTRFGVLWIPICRRV